MGRFIDAIASCYQINHNVANATDKKKICFLLKSIACRVH